MRWVTRLMLAVALLMARDGPALACDPDWDWCGYDRYEPSWYEPPAYEDPAPSWSWSEPVYEPAPIYEPPSYYEPPVFYEPPAYYDPPSYYEPPVLYEPPAYYEPPPVHVASVDDYPPAYEPMPVLAPPPAPAWSDPVVWTSPGSDVLDASVPPAPQPAPAPVALAPDADALLVQYGLHRVDQVWAADVVTRSGSVTTYSSSTAAMNAGTGARLVASVGTGEASTYDGLLWNGRMTLSDGRSVKGEIYANYVWNGYDWGFDKYVFFQDDLEIARIATPPTAALPADTPPGTVAPVTVAAGPIAAPMAVPGGSAYVAPLMEDMPTTPASPTLTSPDGPGSALPAPRVVVAGIALAPQADPLGRVEVLRGRRIPLWVRATVDGTPSRVVAWSLVSGELTSLGPISGSGDDPLLATWRSVSPSGTAFVVRLRASVQVTGEGIREADATIDVVVRSPALVE